MPERDTKGEYQLKHAKKITLANYRGVGNGIMELQDEIADGFMRSGDMRSDIDIVQKPNDRVQEYDQLGNVKVAKLLSLPRLDFWRGDGLIQTRKEDDTYVLAIDDQKLATRVADSNDGTRKFDDLFVESFRKESIKGLTGVLRSEKLLNGGRYDLTFLWSYCHTMLTDGIAIPTILATQYATETMTPNSLMITAVAGVGLNVMANGMNLMAAAMNHFHALIRGKQADSGILDTTWNEPFVKHSFQDLAVPPVPVDRVLRGEFYLLRNGEKLITRGDSQKQDEFVMGGQ
ncbi:MAG: hypothetical protein Q7T54_03405 [Candidatus Levybacteria bacterium]|nr:hypothetical protein [Candidatus Levybacteria bacterium]